MGIPLYYVYMFLSMHPNVPPPKDKEKAWKSVLRKLRIMFWSLVVLELILLWSVRQWYAAGNFPDIYNKRNGEYSVPPSIDVLSLIF